MTELEKAAKLALEALDGLYLPGELERVNKAITALRKALAEQPAQEPVAWMHNHIEGNVIAHRPADLDRHPDRWTALYEEPKPCQTCEALARAVMLDQTAHDTHPQAREPLLREIAALSANALDDYKMIQKLMAEREPLTDEQIMDLCRSLPTTQYTTAFARAIEQAHGIKGEA